MQRPNGKWGSMTLSNTSLVTVTRCEVVRHKTVRLVLDNRTMESSRDIAKAVKVIITLNSSCLRMFYSHIYNILAVVRDFVHSI